MTSFKKFMITMCVIITALVIINIKISGVGASTQSVSKWYQTTGKTELAHLSTDIHNVNKNAQSPSGLNFDVACQQLYSASIAASELPQIPNTKLKTEWSAMTVALNNAGLNCIKAATYTHEETVASTEKATNYISVTKLYLITGNKILVKFNKQMK